MEPNLMDDDALLASLRDALASARHPRTEVLIAQGQEAYAFGSVSEEFAALVYDSVLTGDLAGASRAADDVRTVIFESDNGVSLEVEVGVDTIVGQVAPPAPASVLAEFADGRRLPLDTDELGCFTMPFPGRGVVRFHLTRDGRTTVTDWA
jgi:hypothetical protein